MMYSPRRRSLNALIARCRRGSRCRKRWIDTAQQAIALIAWSAGLILTAIAYADSIPFSFQYADAPGVGFNDPVNGPARRAALEFAGSILGNLLERSYPTETINVTVQFTPLTNLIGQAGPVQSWVNYPEFAFQNTGYGDTLANHLVGLDIDPSMPEIQATFDSNSIGQFYFGTDSMPPINSFDFVKLAMHELVHGLSFVHDFNADGTVNGSFPDIYNRLVQLGQGATAQLLMDLTQAERAAALVSGNLYWSGSAGILGNGGSEPQLHAPAMFLPASSVSHLSETVYTTSLMTPNLGFGPSDASHVVSPIERGMLRDLGWEVPISGIRWTGGGGNDVWLNPANWQNGVVPQPRDTITFGPSPQTQVLIDYEGRTPEDSTSRSTIESINFTANAPQYTLMFRYTTETTIDGAGVINNSPAVQMIEVHSFFDQSFVIPGIFGPEGKVLFRNSATAGNANVHYQISPGIAWSYTIDQMGLIRLPPAEVSFHDNSTAGGAEFFLEGGSGDGVFGGFLRFHDNSNAGSAHIAVEFGKPGFGLPVGTIGHGFGGILSFRNFSSAATATIHNLGNTQLGNGAGTEFLNFSTADRAMIINEAATDASGVSGFTHFAESSTAGQATILNESSTAFESGATRFFGFATADRAVITNKGGAQNFYTGGRTIFNDNSVAGTATLINEGNVPGALGTVGGVTEFRGDSSADHATVRLLPAPLNPGEVRFFDRATGGNANIVLETSAGIGFAGIASFHDQSLAGAAQITIPALAFSATIHFDDDSSAGSSTITLADFSNGSVEFHGASSAGTASLNIGFDSGVNFFANSSAGNAVINLGSGANAGFTGGFSPNGDPTTTAANATITLGGTPSQAGLNLSANSTAGNATINNLGGAAPGTIGGAVRFGFGSRAGYATIITHGGTNGGLPATTTFAGDARGENARIITHAGGTFDVGGTSFYGGTSVGSIEGAGMFVLEHAHLTVGSLNTDTAVDGQLVDLNPQAGTGGMLTKVGTGTLRLNGMNTYAGLTTVAEGRLNVNGSIPGPSIVLAGATLGGTGSMGPVQVDPGGAFAPGESPGTITTGGLTLQNGSQVLFELGAVSDLIVVNGDLTLGGTLILSLVEGFTPTLGQSFPLITGALGTVAGQFADIITPVGLNLAVSVNYGATEIRLNTIDVVPLPGDYNDNGVVDAADYVVWRKNLGSGTSLLNDDTPGVGEDDFDRWVANFGSTNAGGGTASASDTAAPEPASLALCALVSVGLLFFSGRKR